MITNPTTDVVVQVPSRKQGQYIDEMALAKAEELLGNRARIKVLEAGCGAASHVFFKAEVECFGIDVSAEQLAKNSDVHHKILGDIQTYALARNQFDVVVCWDVLEHLAQPRAALANMFYSLKADGILILGFPHLLSFKGLVTKFTPLWFHTCFYKYIMRSTSRPFKTYLRPAILPNRVIEFARENGLVQEYLRLEEGSIQRKMRQRFRTLGVLFALIEYLVRAFSRGHGSSLYHDSCVMILRKKMPDLGLDSRY